MISTLRVFIFALLMLGGAGFLACAPHALAADAGTTQKLKQDYENRLASVGALADVLKTDAGKPGVRDALGKVEASRKEADGLAAAGEYEIARSLLDDGYRVLTATLAKVKSAPGQSLSAQSAMAEPVNGTKRERNLVERDIVSSKTLIDALKGQNAEKNAGKGAEIAKIEADTQQAQSLLAAGKVGDADKLIDDAYARAKTAIVAMQKPSSMKTGSAALDSPKSRDMGGMSGEQKKGELDARLKSIDALREALKRRNPNTAEIARSEHMASEVGRLAASNPDKAMSVADEAYNLLKVALTSGGN